MPTSFTHQPTISWEYRPVYSHRYSLCLESLAGQPMHLNNVRIIELFAPVRSTPARNTAKLSLSLSAVNKKFFKPRLCNRNLLQSKNSLNSKTCSIILVHYRLTIAHNNYLARVIDFFDLFDFITMSIT